MLNLLLIGPSGIGKSSAVRIAKRLLNYIHEAERPQFFEGGSTKEKLHRDLVHQPKAVLFAPELAAFFSREKYKESLVPYVTQLLDYEEVLELRTIKDNVIRVHNPSVTIIGGSTVAWLQDQLPDSAVTGGFLARFLILYEEEKGQRIANPHRLLTVEQRRKLAITREEVFKEFATLAAVHEGEIDYEDYDAAAAYANWYNRQEPEVGYLAPFAARAGEMILRLSILLAISSKRNSMSKEDIECAIQLYEYLTGNLTSVIVPMTKQSQLEAQILTKVDDENLSQITKDFRNQAGAKEVERAVEDLVFTGELAVDTGGFHQA